MLIWGPLSDKYGRKPILFTGSISYILSSILIAQSDSIETMLFWRCLQAAGSGAISSMAMAIVKDLFRGRSMEKAITNLQTIVVLAPMLAPVLGGVLLRFTDWRGTFWCLVVCGVLAGLGTLGLREPLRAPIQGSAFSVLARIPVVLSDRGFRSLLLACSAMCMPFMAYIGVSSFIYQNLFHLSAQEYSYFFAVNASMSLAGPVLHARIFSTMQRRKVIASHLGIICMAGIGILLFGSTDPVVFALLYAPISLCSGALRPSVALLMMKQIKNDNGTVTALMNSTALLFGSVSMFLCSLSFWSSAIVAAGSVCCVIGGGVLLYWLRLNKRHSYKE